MSPSHYRALVALLQEMADEGEVVKSIEVDADRVSTIPTPRPMVIIRAVRVDATYTVLQEAKR